MRRSAAVLALVSLFSSVGVYLAHDWFHEVLLPALKLSAAAGDALGGFIIILTAYIGQRAISLVFFRDTEHGSTLAVQQMQQANQKMQAELGELDLLASTDKLTGAWNRRRLEETANNEMNRLKRYKHPLCLLIFDIDFFKTVNDRHGHNVGDQVLVELAEHVRSILRTSDSLTRWGGEEFVVLCPNTTLSTATLLAERLRAKIAGATFPEVKQITISIGVAECLHEETWEQWFQRTDAALYRAKSCGRNQVKVAQETPRRDITGESVSANFVRLVWHKAYECGHEVIDRQHQALFNDANNLLNAILTQQPTDEVGLIIDTLIRDVVQHFHDEETIITAAGYPGDMEHSNAHRELVNNAVMLVNQFRAGTLNTGELFHFLAVDMVARHLLCADREFFPYLEVQPAGSVR